MGKKLKWTVEFSVDECWVADGFILNDETALDMLANQLGWADIETELSAKVIKSPTLDKIMKLQGFKDKCDFLRANNLETKASGVSDV